VFASSAFVPTSSMPGIVHWFADVNPVSLTVNAARALMIGHAQALAPTLAGVSGITALDGSDRLVGRGFVVADGV
jgi:ABC-type polysaccharide/polyol phosphate export permease